MRWLLLLVIAASPLAAEDFSFAGAQSLAKTYCAKCHNPKTPIARLDVTRLQAPGQSVDERHAWSVMLRRVRSGEMPPKGNPAPSFEQREQFVAFVDRALRSAACAGGVQPGRAPVRRLNRNEYAATLRDLLNIHINAGAGLPADGAGGEGFDNAAETLFLSPIHAEKYLEAARQALDYAFTDTRSRALFLIAEPGAGVTAEQAAQKVLERFLPRAFRRPARDGEVERYLRLFRSAQARGETYERAIEFALQAVLVSPHFLFRVEPPNHGSEPRLVDPYAMASRLSYFLWESMPDAALFDLAASGKLQDEEVLNEQIVRMLKDVKAREFAEHFVEQWLGTRELGRDIKPDAKLFPKYYDADLQGAIRYEPVLFFQELLAHNYSLLALIDSNFTILTDKLARHYALPTQGLSQQPKRYDLPEDSHRGGILGMAAVLAVSSYPQRTSPVLRGKWILDAMLGTPPPPPPPNVPQLKEDAASKAGRTLRERLEEHRQNPVCASCHNRIDPLGFGLENYDVIGRWRSEDSGKSIDPRGVMPGGASFNGPEQMKEVLMDQKDLFVRNLTTKMLGYALGRGLTIEDHCAVDRIVAKLERDEFRAQTLIREIVLGVPFRFEEKSK